MAKTPKKIKYKSAAHKKAALEAEAFRVKRDKEWGITGKKIDKKVIKKEFVMNTSYRGSDVKIASVIAPTGGRCAKPSGNTYTGTLIKGIATMHKSNAVPVIDQEQMIEISRMRRG